jgi:hypothetical protein
MLFVSNIIPIDLSEIYFDNMRIVICCLYIVVIVARKGASKHRSGLLSTLRTSKVHSGHDVVILVWHSIVIELWKFCADNFNDLWEYEGFSYIPLTCRPLHNRMTHRSCIKIKRTNYYRFLSKQITPWNHMVKSGVYHKRGFEISMAYQKRLSCGHQKRVSCFSSRIHLQLPVLSLHVFNLKL